MVFDGFLGHFWCFCFCFLVFVKTLFFDSFACFLDGLGVGVWSFWSQKASFGCFEAQRLDIKDLQR